MSITHPALAGLLALALSACSLTPETPPPTPATLFPVVVVPTVLPATPTVPPPPSATPPPTVTWGGVPLSGTLIFLTATTSAQSPMGFLPTLASLNLATGALQTLFTAPVSAVLSSGSLSPDGQHLALAYAPPPPGSDLQFGFPGLYLLPGDGQGDPQRLLDRSADKHAYFQPSWSPDGAYLYYTHYDPHFDGAGYYTPTYTVERWNLAAGQAEVIATGAYWPRLSDDGTRLVYVTLDATNTLNELYVSAPDGSAPVRLDLPADLIVDVPLFSPDNQWVYFSAADLSFPAANWLDRLLGVGQAEAAPEPHSIPSDWWRVPVAGGPAEQLTDLYGTALYGAFSRDGRYLAFVNAGGLFLTDPLGQTFTPLLTDTQLVGTLDWRP